ncbi:hypothetical protein [Granulosicoccus antarcticus]|uniref:Uncharacterized protein n=1 Tax=Granulosicoccus antarcticus IMCC3135 TaxID=1192854 RepID=A0A2Z2P412_9GAMM|nr:hypothetical protein [Granulosicoccus antarcticus]ASJ76150.1 hypothetical protein IMCC3135_30505 [Granulosicoccus antarcticus IMCC3135]
MSPTAPVEQFSGAMTLLRECVGGMAGERLLIVSEPQGSGFYDDAAPRITAAAGRALNMRVYQTQSDCFLASAEDTSTLMETLKGFDHIVFFSRVGDQIRFSDDSDMPSSTMCYTLDLESLNSPFGTACYFGMCEIKKVIDAAFIQAEHVRLSCPMGTTYEGRPDWGLQATLNPALKNNEAKDVRIKRFPMLISQPVPSKGLSGKIALSRFLVGTGSQYYEPYHLPLKSTVFAHVANNRISHFEGSPEEVLRVEQHYEHVSSKFDIDPLFVHSWHAGIHPGCHFQPLAETDIMRWSGSAFGNPRILHFHTCGDYAPGEISWNILDPTIWIDDVPVWENGQLFPERLPNSAEALDSHPHLVELYKHPYREVGLVA